jgi:hypothetical protein
VADVDDRGFVQHDALVTGKYQGVGGTEVDREVGGKVPTESSKHVRNPLEHGLRVGRSSLYILGRLTG